MEPIELRSPWPAATVLGAPSPFRFGCPLHAGELLPCRRCAAWLATRRLQLVVNRLGVPVALIDRGPLLSVVYGDKNENSRGDRLLGAARARTNRQARAGTGPGQPDPGPRGATGLSDL